MERRVLLAIFLAFLVLYVWQAMFVKPVPQPTTPSTAATAPQGTETAPTPASSPPVPTPEAPAANAPAAVLSDTSERDIRVETQDVIATFTNKGGRLKSWRLKHYHDKQGQAQELVESHEPLPFTLRTGDAQIDGPLNTVLYAVNGASDSVPISAPIDVRFEYRDAAGLHAVKEFHLEPSSYVLGFRAAVDAGDKPMKPAVVWGPAVGDQGETSSYTQKAEGLLYVTSKPQRLAAKDFAKQPTYDGEFKYVGVDDNYFMTVALAPGPSKVTFRPVPSPPAAGSKDPPRELVAYELEPREPAKRLRFFFGPKDFDVLAATD